MPFSFALSWLNSLQAVRHSHKHYSYGWTLSGKEHLLCRNAQAVQDTQGKSHLVYSAGTLENLPGEGLQQKLQARAMGGQ